MEHYRNLAQKIIDRYADDNIHFVGQIAADMKTSEMYIIRAVGLIDSKYAIINIPENYDGRKGPGIKINPTAKEDASAVVAVDQDRMKEKTKASLPTEETDEDEKASVDLPKKNDEEYEDEHEDEDEDEESAGVSAIMNRIKVMVTLDIMLGQASNAMAWVVDNVAEDAFGIDDDKALRVISAVNEVMGALAKIKGEF